MPKSAKVEAATPEPHQSPIGQRKITAEQKARIEEMATQGMTVDFTSETLGIPRGTVATYRARWEEGKRELEELSSITIRRERTPDVLKKILEGIPGIGAGKSAFAVMAMRANPLIQTNPMELYQLCVNGLSLTHYSADLVTKAFFHEAFAQNPQLAGSYYPQGSQGQGVPNYPQPGNVQPVQTPNGVVYMPMPQVQSGMLTESRVREILEDQREQEYIEEEAPIIGPDGKPVLGSKGETLYRRIRRPASATQPEQQMANYLALFKAMGVVPDAAAKKDGGLIETIEVLTKLGLVGKQNGGMDATLQQTLATIQAELAAERARNQERDHYSKILWGVQEKLTSAETAMAVAKSGMSANDQVQLKVVESSQQMLAKAIDNNEKRMDRAERVLGPLVRGFQNQQAGGVTMPVVPQTDADLAALAAQAQATQDIAPSPQQSKFHPPVERSG